MYEYLLCISKPCYLKAFLPTRPTVAQICWPGASLWRVNRFARFGYQPSWPLRSVGVARLLTIIPVKTMLWLLQFPATPRAPNADECPLCEPNVDESRAPLPQRMTRPLFFIHIPKCAGSTVEVTYPCMSWGRNMHCSDELMNYVRARSTWHDHVLVPTMPGDTFCVVRDPLDRLLSEYKHNKSLDCVATMNRALELMCTLAQTYALDNHLRPQSSFARHATHVVALPRLQEGLDQLLPRYGIRSVPLLKSNVSRSYTHVTRANVAARVLRRVRRTYACDYALLARVQRAGAILTQPEQIWPRSGS
jgi:hypothetical protein